MQFLNPHASERQTMQASHAWSASSPEKHNLGWQLFHLLPLILFSVKTPLKTDTRAKATEDLQKKYQDKTLWTKWSHKANINMPLIECSHVSPCPTKEWVAVDQVLTLQQKSQSFFQRPQATSRWQWKILPAAFPGQGMVSPAVHVLDSIESMLPERADLR